MIQKIDPNETRIFSGSSHPELAAGIAAHLGLPLEKTHFSRFSNDNLFIQLSGSVRGRVVFIVQSLTPPVSDHLLELLMMLDIARSAAAKEVHAIIPYYSYARSDKKNAPRISIAARLIADLLQTAGATHVMTMTLHSPQVHGFFSVPTDPLTARGLFENHFRDKEFNPQDTIVVAPDYGRAASAARLANQLGLPSISAEKTRISDTEVHIGELIGKQVAGFRKVTGKLLMSSNPVTVATGAPRVLDARNAFLMSSMMQDVARRGTAARVSQLGRTDLAGKTGTTNDQRDGWFAGFSPDLVAVSWIGFDQPKSLGPGETGSQSALRIWIDFMGKALAKTPHKAVVAPEGIVSATLDPETGKLLPEGAAGITEYFYQESLPSNENPVLNLLQEMTGKEPPKAGGGI